MAKRASRKKTSAGVGGVGSGGRQRAASGGAGRQLARLHVWQIQAVRDLLLVAAIVALFWAGYALRAVTVPLLVALLLAYLFEPLVARLARHPRISRAAAVGGLLAAVGVVVLIALAFVLPLIVGQTTQFIGDVRDGRLRERIGRIERFVPAAYREDFQSFLEILPASLEPRFEAPSSESSESPADAASGPITDPVEDSDAAVAAGGAPPLTAGELDRLVGERVDTEMRRLREELAAVEAQQQEQGRGFLDLSEGSVNVIVRVLGAVVQIGLLAFLIPFYFFFFSLWYPDVLRFGRDLLPRRNKDRVLHLLGKMDEVVAGFVRGRIVISLIMGVMLAIGWMICGVPYAIPLGLVVGVFCAVPYLGGVGIPLAVGLLFFDQLSLPADERSIWLGWFGVVLWPALVFAVIQFIEGYVLVPYIAGRATGLDPVTILVVVLAGGSVLGVYGMLLAIPVAACGKILLMEVVLPKVRAWMRGEIADPLPIERD